MSIAVSSMEPPLLVFCWDWFEVGSEIPADVFVIDLAVFCAERRRIREHEVNALDWRFALINEHPVQQRIVTWVDRSEEHTSELQSLMRISYAVFCLKKKTKNRY